MDKIKDIDTVIKEERMRKQNLQIEDIVKSYKLINEKLAFLNGVDFQIKKEMERNKVLMKKIK